uniref:Uncharacterized protein n=1 Tax=Oryza brachyantha TaxID=4533 RepID=J3N3V0_ORYBR
MKCQPISLSFRSKDRRIHDTSEGKSPTMHRGSHGMEETRYQPGRRQSPGWTRTRRPRPRAAAAAVPVPLPAPGRARHHPRRPGQPRHRRRRGEAGGGGGRHGSVPVATRGGERERGESCCAVCVSRSYRLICLVVWARLLSSRPLDGHVTAAGASRVRAMRERRRKHAALAKFG